MKKICEGDNEDGEDSVVSQESDLRGNETRQNPIIQLFDVSGIHRMISAILSNLPDVKTLKSLLSSLDSSVLFFILSLIVIAQWNLKSTARTCLDENISLAMNKNDLEILSQKFDDLVAEVRETKEALVKILDLLSEKEGNL